MKIPLFDPKELLPSGGSPSTLSAVPARPKTVVPDKALQPGSGRTVTEWSPIQPFDRADWSRAHDGEAVGLGVVTSVFRWRNDCGDNKIFNLTSPDIELNQLLSKPHRWV